MSADEIAPVNRLRLAWRGVVNARRRRDSHKTSCDGCEIMRGSELWLCPEGDRLRIQAVDAVHVFDRLCSEAFAESAEVDSAPVDDAPAVPTTTGDPRRNGGG